MLKFVVHNTFMSSAAVAWHTCSRCCRAPLQVTRMRRVEAVDKLLSVLTLLVASVFGLQAIGLDGKPVPHSPFQSPL